MSVERSYYAIVGYDITGCLTEKCEDWFYTEEGEKYTCYKKKGNIQILDDPRGSNYVHFGYILGDGDQWSFDPIKFDIDDIYRMKDSVRDELMKLVEIGIVNIDINHIPKYQVIVFEECS